MRDCLVIVLVILGASAAEAQDPGLRANQILPPSMYWDPQPEPATSPSLTDSTTLDVTWTVPSLYDGGVEIVAHHFDLRFSDTGPWDTSSSDLWFEFATPVA